jgi:hypothetical protein
MLAGTNPLGGANAQEMLARRFSGQVPSLRGIREIPDAVDAAIHKALATTPADRYSTAAEFVDALKRSAPVHAPTWRFPRRSRPQDSRGSGDDRRRTDHGAKHDRAALRYGLGGPRGRPSLAVRAGESFAYLAEGLVDLMSRNLDGAGDLHTVDPGTILTAVGKNKGTLDAARGRDVARDMGAGLFILGSVNAIDHRYACRPRSTTWPPRPTVRRSKG